MQHLYGLGHLSSWEDLMGTRTKELIVAVCPETSVINIRLGETDANLSLEEAKELRQIVGHVIGVVEEQAYLHERPSGTTGEVDAGATKAAEYTGLFSRQHLDAVRADHGRLGQEAHASDCAVHNAPAYQAGECDCGKE